jgi:acetyl-CoA carboxylase carboxyltransferase component
VKNDKNSAQLRKQLENESSPARDFISGLFDERTFTELGAYIRRVPNEADKLFGTPDEGDFESVICGYGAVEGRLVYAFAQDSTKMKGALTSAHAKKITDLLDKALQSGAPVVGVFSSNGAVVTEGVAGMAGYGAIIRRFTECKGEIPLISIVDGVCASTAAAIASISDVTAITDKGSLYVAPPFILKERYSDNSAGSADFAAETGQADIRVKSSAEAAETVRTLLTKLPSNSGEVAVDVSDDDLNRLTPEISSLNPDSLDIHDVIKAVSDEGFFFELGAGYAPELVSGIISLGGRSVGVVANQPEVNGGRITPKAAEKASKLIDLCDSFNIPILTLVDTLGFDISGEAEKYGFSQSLGLLGFSYSSASVPLVTVVIGPAYGGAYVLMGSKSLGADVCYALDTARIAPLAPDAAAEFLKGEMSKDEAKKIYGEKIASPLAAAKAGDIDDIIAAEELRQHIISAFEMLCS